MSTAPARGFSAGMIEVPEDLTPWLVGGARPEGVASPRSVDEVRDVLRAADEAGLGVVPLGGRTDPGCERPGRPFLVLSTHRLAGVEDYEPADLTVTAGGGTSLGDLDRELAAHGQWLPADPPGFARRTLGGLVATGAAGPLGISFGAPRDHVLGLTLVTGDARVLKLGGRVMKNVAGFDLVKLTVGSRGTLGVVVSATVRLFPRTEVDRAVIVRAERPADLLAAARAVATSAVVPASAVLTAPAPGSPGDGAAALVVRLQGAAAGVDSDERRLRADLPEMVVRLDGAEAAACFTTCADHASDGELVVRLSAMPASLPEVLSAVTTALPRAAITADVLAGRLRASRVEAEGVDTAALVELRRRMEALGGSMALERAPSGLVAGVGAYGARGRTGEIEAALRARFDPKDVLSPGRFQP